MRSEVSLFRKVWPAVCVDIPLVCIRYRSRSTEDQLEEHAERRGALVPVSIDLDVDTFKIRDTFVWNVQGAFEWHSKTRLPRN